MKDEKGKIMELEQHVSLSFLSDVMMDIG